MADGAVHRRLVVLVLLAALAACQSQPPTVAVVPSPIPVAVLPAAPTDPQVAAAAEPAAADDAEAPLPAPATDLWERIRRQLAWHQSTQLAWENSRRAYLDQPDYLRVVSERAKRYLHYIVGEVEARGMPIEVALVPIVESTLNPFAVSPRGAAGLWQIMPGTADFLGMRRDWWFDARYDLVAATDVALDYLQALHDEFDDDWLLALAAYNAGKGRVMRARAENARHGRPGDYWSLRLPRETRHYVPRLLALASIIGDARALGLALPPVANRPALRRVDTGGQIELLRAAQLAGLDLRELRRLNAGHQRWATAPGTAALLLPQGKADEFSGKLASLAPADRVTWEHYRIRSGDSLIRIARRFDTQVALLREVNNIRGTFIRAGDTLMIPDGGSWSDSLAMASGSDLPREQRDYRVRRGDSLYLIASRFKVTIDDLINWNELDPQRYLQPGQQLTLYLGGD